MRTLVWYHEWVYIWPQKELYPLQVTVHYAKAVHVLQPIRSINQLNEPVMSVSTKYCAITHELDTIYKIVDVSVIHPPGHHGKSTIHSIYTAHNICTEQR